MSARPHHRVMLRVRSRRGIETLWIVGADGVPLLVWMQVETERGGLLIGPFASPSR